MVAMWVDPHLIPMYKSYGVVPISRADWKELGLTGTSPTINMDSPDGWVYRDSGSVCAAWTTATRKREMDIAESEAARRAMGARTAKYQESVSSMDAYGLSNGVPHFTEDNLADDGEFGSDDSFIAMPGRGAPKVSLAGPKMPGTKVWKDSAEASA